MIVNPKGPNTGKCHVFRGSTWYHSASFLVISARGGSVSNFRYDGLGFRIVCNGRKG